MPDFKAMYRTVMDDHFPPEMSVDFGGQRLVYRKRAWKIEDDGALVEKGLRYGENPGQEAALYELVAGNLVLGDCRFIGPGEGLVSALDENDLLQFGKHPGKTNLTDIDNALNILRYLDGRPACCIMKHNNPCGAAYGQNAAHAYARANAADRLAAFGGAAVLNTVLDAEAAREIAREYLEVVVAPDFGPGAVDILKARKNLRIVRIGRIDRLREYAPRRFVDFKSLIDGGLIVQQSPLNRIRDAGDFLPARAKRKNGDEARTAREPTEREKADLLFAWQVEQGVTSNSVLFVKDEATVGIGAGEQDRVGVAEIAILKAYKKLMDDLAFTRHGVLFFECKLKARAGELPEAAVRGIEEEARVRRGNLEGSAAASDAFFPKRDGIDALAAERVAAVAQPGGSLADAGIIDAANEAGMAMVFTGQRAFKH